MVRASPLWKCFHESIHLERGWSYYTLFKRLELLRPFGGGWSQYDPMEEVGVNIALWKRLELLYYTSLEEVAAILHPCGRVIGHFCEIWGQNT